MLRSIRELLGYSVAADEYGTVVDFLFDEEIWIVRYFIVARGKGLIRRQVAIPATAFRRPDDEARCLRTRSSRAEVESPRQVESGPVAPVGWPAKEQNGGQRTVEAHLDIECQSSHLRSGREFFEYQLQAEEGTTAQIEDLIVNDGTWGIYYLVVESEHWQPSQKVLVSPFSAAEVDPVTETVAINLSWEVIKNGPRYDRSRPLQPKQKGNSSVPYGRLQSPAQIERRNTLPI